jgi:hypothetical protein
MKTMQRISSKENSTTLIDMNLLGIVSIPDTPRQSMDISRVGPGRLFLVEWSSSLDKAKTVFRCLWQTLNIVVKNTPACSLLPVSHQLL